MLGCLSSIVAALSIASSCQAPLQPSSSEGLSDSEKKGLADALFIRNLTLPDLNFVRRSGKEPVLPLAQMAIDQPLEAAGTLMRLHGAPKDGAWAALSSALLLMGESSPSVPVRSPVTLPPSVPAALRQAIGSLVEAIASANKEIATALAPLTPVEKRTLIDSLPQLSAGSEAKFDFVKNPPAKAKEVDALLAKVSLPTLLWASVHLSTAVNQQLSVLQNLPLTLDHSIEFTVSGIPVEIGSTGHDVHSKAVGGLCIDLGGDDVYTGRYGAGAGLSSVVIDLGGNDDYEVHDFAMGAGLLGVGLAYDLGGNDRFHGGSLTFGAGLAGVGVFYKSGGDDTYIGDTLTQGFGRSGLGLLLDSGGSDRYRAKTLSQGSAQMRGLGWLADVEGDDDYVATGPRCQGAAAGGVGLLSDEKGDDRYDGTSECQAFGTDFGVGSLLDEMGRDTYTSDHASEAFAADSRAAFLIDLSGNDIYAARGGACFGTAQARSVAMLLDRGGNDLYAAGDGRPGLATDNSLAVFLDADGHDRYSISPGGSVTGRSGDGLGLFVDLSGSDGYPTGTGAHSDGTARVDLDGGIAYDVRQPSSTPDIVSTEPKPGSMKDPGVEALDILWDDVSTAASDKLVAIGVPALHRFIDTRLSTADVREMSTAIRIVQALGLSGRPIVVAALPKTTEISDVPAARNSIVLCGVSMSGEAAPVITRLLAVEDVQRQAAEAAGLLRAKEAVPALLPLAGSSGHDLALAAMVALERINDEAALSTSQSLAASSQYPIRQAAMRFLGRYSASATRTTDRLLADPDETTQRLGIELLGRMGSPEALTLVGRYLTANSVGLKIQAMLALQGKCPPSIKPTLQSLRDDPNPLVKAVAIGIEGGS